MADEGDNRALDFILRQSVDTQLSMIRGAAREQDVVSLELLERAGLLEVEDFFAPGNQRFSLRGRYTSSEHAAVAALAAFCETLLFDGPDVDAVAGVAIHDSIATRQLSLASIEPAFQAFYARKVGEYIDAYEDQRADFLRDNPVDDPRRMEETQVALQAYVATLSVLLVGCCALHDATTARRVCAALVRQRPATFSSGVVDKLAVSESLIERGLVIVEKMVHPALVAVLCNAHGVLDAMVEAGFGLDQHLAVLQPRSGNLGSARRWFTPVNAVCHRSDAMGLLIKGDITLMPSMLERVVQAARGDGGDARRNQMLKDWAESLLTSPRLTGGNLNSDAIGVAVRQKIYLIDPVSAMNKAAAVACIEVMDCVKNAYPWKSPPKEQPHVIAELLTSPLWSIDREQAAQALEIAMEWAVSQGAGRLLADPMCLRGRGGEEVSTPLIYCVHNAIAIGVMSCLEQGADPCAPDSRGVSALSAARAAGLVELEDLLLSSSSARQARTVLDELGL